MKQEEGFRAHLITFGRIIKTGFRNLFRNAWLTVAAIAVMVVTLSIILFGFIAYKSLNDTIEDISKDFTVSIFIEDEVTVERRSVLKADLIARDELVEGIVFKTKEQALADFENRFRDNPDLLEGVGITGNVFPASYEVLIADPEFYDEIINIAEDEKYTDIVLSTGNNELKRDSFRGFADTKNFLVKASVIAAVVFGTISVLIIFNTIRMAIFTRAREIEIMKLIGAKPGFIRGPFLVEASFYGILAALASVGIAYSGLIGLSSRLKADLIIEPTQDIFIEYWYVVFICALGIGMLIGYMSSIVAMSRYLRLRKW